MHKVLSKIKVMDHTRTIVVDFLQIVVILMEDTIHTNRNKKQLNKSKISHRYLSKLLLINVDMCLCIRYRKVQNKSLPVFYHSETRYHQNVIIVYRHWSLLISMSTSL
jgi:hypothetical protein